MSVNSKMTAIADAIRGKTGISGTLNLDEMAEAIAGIQAGSGKTVAEVGCTTTVSTGNLIGDVNGDGVVDSTDEELAAQYMADGGEGDIDVATADFDGDGQIGMEDVIQLSRLVAELGTGQIVAKVTILYTDGTSETGYLPIDAPIAAGASGSQTIHFDAITSAHGLVVGSASIIGFSGTLFVKASDTVYSQSELIGKVATMKRLSGESSSLTVTEDLIEPLGTGNSFFVSNYGAVIQPEDAGTIIESDIGIVCFPSAGTYLLWSSDLISGDVITIEVGIQGELTPYSTEGCNVNVTLPEGSMMMYYGGMNYPEYNTPYKFNTLVSSADAMPITVGKGETIFFIPSGAAAQLPSTTENIQMFVALVGSDAVIMYKVMGDGEITIPTAE